MIKHLRAPLFALFALLVALLSACGDLTATTVPAATTAPAAAATTAPAMTTAPAATTVAMMATTAPAFATATPATTAVTPAGLATGATSATTSGTATGEVIVFAAASLTDSFNQIKTAFEAAHPGTKVTLSFGGSSTLRTQLGQGAKADVFASADQSNMDQALTANVVADKGTVFARNRLVIIVPKTNKATITTPADIAKPGIKFVTAQKSVPVGNYTLQVLDKMSKDATFGSDFSTKVQANFVSQETDVKQIVAKIQTGEGDAGIVYKTDVTEKVAKDVTVIDIPDSFNVIATYPIAFTKTPLNAALAQKFVDYVLSADGQAALQKNGFIAAK